METLTTSLEQLNRWIIEFAQGQLGLATILSDNYGMELFIPKETKMMDANGYELSIEDMHYDAHGSSVKDMILNYDIKFPFNSCTYLMMDIKESLLNNK